MSGGDYLDEMDARIGLDDPLLGVVFGAMTNGFGFPQPDAPRWFSASDNRWRGGWPPWS